MPVRSRRPTAAQWLAGARLRTLPAAIAPVLAGTGVAAANTLRWPRGPRRYELAILASCGRSGRRPSSAPRSFTHAVVVVGT